MKPCLFPGWHMLFLVVFLWVAFGRDYSHSQETPSETKGSCPQNFVVGSSWLHLGEPCATTISHCDSATTPFCRPSIHTTSSIRDGLCTSPEPILEVFPMQTYGKSPCSFLCQLWRTLDQGRRELCYQLRCSTAFEFTKKATETIRLAVLPRKLGQPMATTRPEEDGKPKEERQGKGKRGESSGYSLCTSRAPNRRAMEATITALYCCFFYTGYVDYTFYGGLAIASIDQLAQEEQGRAAIRGPSFDPESTGGGFKVTDQTDARRSGQPRQKQEDVARSDPWSKPTTPILEQVPRGSNSSLAKIRIGFSGAGQGLQRKDRGGQECSTGKQGGISSSPKHYQHAPNARGDLRRRVHCTSAQDRGAHGQVDSHPSGVERWSGRGDRATGLEETTCRWNLGTSCQGCRYEQYTRWWWSAFSKGRQVSCTPIACQCPLALSWTHSVVQAPDFVSTWEAIDVAYSKTFWFGPVPGHASGYSHALLRSTFECQREAAPTTIPTDNRKPKKVRFRTTIDVRLTTDTVVADFMIPKSVLDCWNNKPWQLDDMAKHCKPAWHIDATYLMQTSAQVVQHPGLAQCAEPNIVIAEDVIELLRDPHRRPNTNLVTSYGLQETSVGTRSFSLLDFSIAHFTSQVRACWPEFSAGSLRIHLVKPQPQSNVASLHVIAESIMQDEPHESIEPTLDETVVWSAYGQPDVERHALYHQRRLKHSDITSTFADICHRARFVCTARALGMILPRDWTRSICAGALIQLHAYPPQILEPFELVEYFYGMTPFLRDSLEILGETTPHRLLWRIHLLLGDGYHGVAESETPITSVASASAVADSAFGHWNLDLPGALVYAGIQWTDTNIQHFIAFDPDVEGFPCFIQTSIDDRLDVPAPPAIAAYVPPICTIRELIKLLNIPWILDMTDVTISVSDGSLSFDLQDRFKPHHGDLSL